MSDADGKCVRCGSRAQHGSTICYSCWNVEHSGYEAMWPSETTPAVSPPSEPQNRFAHWSSDLLAQRLRNAAVVLDGDQRALLEACADRIDALYLADDPPSPASERTHECICGGTGAIVTEDRDAPWGGARDGETGCTVTIRDAFYRCQSCGEQWYTRDQSDAHFDRLLKAVIEKQRVQIAADSLDAERWRYLREQLSDGGTVTVSITREVHRSVRMQNNIGAWFPFGVDPSVEEIVDAARSATQGANE